METACSVIQVSLGLFLIAVSAVADGAAGSVGVGTIGGRHLLQQKQDQPLLPLLAPLNPNLRAAYVALHAWKSAITDDPNGITATWKGYDVCKYAGVFCAPPPVPVPDCELVVAGIDLNHANIAGTLPPELGLLNFLAIFHINTNRFSGEIPVTIAAWHYLYEFDVSNNLFCGGFPEVVLTLPSLAFLDIRFNKFSDELPSAVFDKKLDALFVNDNYFTGEIPSNLGNSPVSVAVFARNHFTGRIPDSIGQMSATLNEIIFLGNDHEGCVPESVGNLQHLTVFDVSFNRLSGYLPHSLAGLFSIEQLDFGDNLLSGKIPGRICSLPHLQNFTVSYNFFTSEDFQCPALNDRGAVFDDTGDCIRGRPAQRPAQECSAFFASEQLCPIPKPPPPPVYVYPSPPPPAYYTPTPPYP